MLNEGPVIVCNVLLVVVLRWRGRSEGSLVLGRGGGRAGRDGF